MAPLDDLSDRLTWLIAQLKLKELPADGSGALEVLRDLATAQQRITTRTRGEAPMLAIAEAIGLTDTETQVVTLLAGHQLHPWVRARVDSLAGPSPVAGVAVSTISTLVYGTNISATALSELGPTGCLRRFGVVKRIERQEGEAWSLNQRVIAFLVGASADYSLFVSRDGSIERNSSELAVDRGTLAQAANAVRATASVVCIAGAPSSGRRTLIQCLAQEIGTVLLVVDARRLSCEVGELKSQVQEIALECRLRASSPLLLNIQSLADEKSRLAIMACELSRLIKGSILTTCSANTPSVSWERPTIVIEMGQPTTSQRATLWHSSLGQGTSEDAQLLAERYPLAPALIVRASEAAKARANGRTLEPDDIYAGIRSVLDDRLGQFAKRVTVTQTWDDLVLPPDQLDTIIELMARVRGRTKVYEQWGFAAKVGKGLGVSALFSGPPGTGKTMVAALIARDLGLELYQVDMGKVVSKFIGETEKNLGALFDAAEAGHAILLFDEADALFGKRTDVKSSNDRYANLETNYLLQRLESFTGICLLTTNHDSHIDPAFQRRLSLHLRFELPDVEERAQLWRATLPIAAPLAGNVDFESLARRYAMSGGYIRNAALRAAFLAADEDSEITAAHLERAARVEYEGMGKIAA